MSEFVPMTDHDIESELHYLAVQTKHGKHFPPFVRKALLSLQHARKIIESYEEQEMGVSSDCWEHEKAAKKEAYEECISLIKGRASANLVIDEIKEIIKKRGLLDDKEI